MVLLYTNLGETRLWIVILINAIMFAGIMSRMIPSTALMTAIPTLQDRGAFMGINSSIQQVAGGIASVFAGQIVIQQNGGPLQHYDTLGYVCSGVMLVCLLMMYFINKHVQTKIHKTTLVAVPV
jgi:predicted MFS family arabinose efflux permease